MSRARSSRLRTILLAAAVAASSLAGSVALSTPASAAGPFDVVATEMWLPNGNRDRLWFRAENWGDAAGRVTGIRCTEYNVVNRGFGTDQEIATNFSPKISATTLAPGAWVGWELKLPHRLIERDEVVCRFVGVDAAGRAEAYTGNNTRSVWGYGQF